MFGELTLGQIPYQNPIIMGATAFMAVIVLAVVVALTVFKRWKWLWCEWLTSVDHKRIGVMYAIVAVLMLVRGFVDAVMMRAQQAIAFHSPGYLPPHHYDQVFTAHGTILIFFMAMSLMVALFNIVVPLQLGARDVAFPLLNSVSFWLMTMAAVLINLSLFIGEFGQVGWLAYPPLSELHFSPGVGVDYYIWSVQLSGVSSLITAINFFVTIVKMRAPGMTMMKMPVFTWTAFCSCVLMMVTIPALTAAVAMLGLDRYLGMHFFTNEGGGNVMLYLNLVWAWGHPEVYILVLPAFGIYSEIIATFAKKPLFSYRTMVYATCTIMFLSFFVWGHHFFTMGAGADVNTFFGLATMIIAVPTGVKIFNWLFTMYRGRIEFTSMVLWTIGFMITFSIGGMTGVMMSIPAADFVLHNTLYLVAHFHNTIIGGVVFGYLAGVTYWFPKVFGFKLNEKLGKCAFWCWFIGFYVAFMPIYVVGFMGMVRRMSHYDNPAWHPWLVVAVIGTAIIALGVVFQVVSWIDAIIKRNRPGYRDLTGDPWGGRTLEWSTSSPPPVYNFAIIPQVQERDAFAHMKETGYRAPTNYTDIHMPSNTSTGFFISLFGLVLGFASVWHIWWLAVLALVVIILIVAGHSFCDNDGYYIPAEKVREIEEKRARVLATVEVK